MVLVSEGPIGCSGRAFVFVFAVPNPQSENPPMALVVIKNNLPRIFGNHLGSLKPGVNEIEEKIWKELELTVAIKHEIAEGNIEVMEIAKASPDAPIAIKDLNVKEAVALVKSTFDTAILNRWAEEETRKQVLDALEKQYDAVAVKSKKQEEESEEEGAEETEA